MKYEELGLSGLIAFRRAVGDDLRGTFEKIFSSEELEGIGMSMLIEQVAVSRNTTAHTLRGLHVQRTPNQGAKIVTCLRGTVFDVTADVRRSSPTFGRVVTTVLTADSARVLLLAPGLAHGFMTLEPESEMLYCLEEPYRPGDAAGVRWDDPELAIPWPAPPRTISEADRTLPSLAAANFGE